MNKNLPKIILIIVGLFSFGSALEVRATETIFVYSAVTFDSQAQEVGGASATWITYGLYDYYDPGVFGALFYANPVDFIDQDGGEGVNDYLYGYYPGYYADFTTNDYRPNKILCTYGEHGLRAIFVPTPFQGYDPYQIASIIPGSYGAEAEINVPYSFAENYSDGDYYVVAETLVCIQTPTVESLTFEEMNSAITDNPTGDFGNGVVFGGGKRIFPDRQTPTDGTNRRIVRVRAQLAGSGGSPTFTSGVRVYFRNFDVDDPSSEPIIDNNGSAGNDNRALVNPAGQLSNTFATTDANGTASVDFTVTMQSGDNFIIAASTDSTYLGGVSVSGTGLQDSEGNQLSTSSGRARRTALLTVWRKVHLEVDSMGPVGNNLASGRITSKATVGSTAMWLDVYPSTGDLEVGRFQGGRMTIGQYNLEVLDNTETAVQVRSNNGSVTVFYNSIFQLFDDDDFNDSDGTFKDGDDGEDVTFRGATKFTETFSRLQPSTDINQNPFAAAYIEPDYTWAEGQTGMNDENVQFELNVPLSPPLFNSERATTNRERDSSGMERDDFWIGYILIAYQWGTTLDIDPPVGLFGAGFSVADSNIVQNDAFTNSASSFSDVPPGAIGSLLFIETMRDSFVTLGTDYLIRTAPHELGHQFGLLGDSSDPSPLLDWGIMDVQSQTLHFVPTHINVLRYRFSSPGLSF